MTPSIALKQIARGINQLNIRTRCPKRPFKARLDKGVLTIVGPENDAVNLRVIQMNPNAEAKEAISSLINAGYLDESSLSPSIQVSIGWTTLMTFTTCDLTSAKIANWVNILARLVSIPRPAGLNGAGVPLLVTPKA